MITDENANYKVAITSIGTANPIYKRPQIEIAELMASELHLTLARKRLLKSIFRASGIDQRHSVLSDFYKTIEDFSFFPNRLEDPFPSTEARMNLYKENALPLALLAIENCLNNLENFNIKHVTHLITVSCTGMYAPGIDIEIVQQLNLKSSVNRMAINFMGCYGVFNALKVANAICQAVPNAAVLIVSVELCSIHFQKNNTLDNIIANSIFADGAGVALIQRVLPLHRKYFILNHFYNELLPDSNKDMAWHIGNQGFDIVLSTYVASLIQTGIPHFLARLLENSELTTDDIDLYAIHPGGVKILEACEKALNISKEQNKYSYHVLHHYGNMSSATILFVLKEIWYNINSQQHLKNIFSCAFGPGLTLESMILNINYRE